MLAIVVVVWLLLFGVPVDTPSWLDGWLCGGWSSISGIKCGHAVHSSYSVKVLVGELQVEHSSFMGRRELS